MDGDVVTSAADLSSSFTSDDAAAVDTSVADASTGDLGGVDELSEPIAPDSEGAEEFDFDALNEHDSTAQAEQDQDSTQPEEQAAEEPAAEPVAEEDLPEGVMKTRDANGKFRYHLNEQRYKLFHGAHAQLREMSEIVGEPLTTDVVGNLRAAQMANDKFYSDLISGDPSAQQGVVNYLLKSISSARENGEVDGNPLVGLTQTLYQALQQDPEAYGALRMQAAKDLIQELYETAGEKQNRNLFLSVGHISNALGLPYRKEAEMQDLFAKAGKDDPMARLAAENAALKDQLNGRQASTRAEQFASWQAQTKQSVTSAVGKDAVLPALQDVRQQGIWAKNQQAFERYVVAPLNSEVAKTINSDKAFLDRIEVLNRQARMATSEERRDAIRNDIQRLYVNRASMVVEAKKAQIIKDAVATLKSQSDANHQRRAASQQHRAPATTGTPVKRSLVAPRMDESEVATVGSLRRSLDGLIH